MTVAEFSEISFSTSSKVEVGQLQFSFKIKDVFSKISSPDFKGIPAFSAV
jgi:hypothetical protein